MSDTVYNNRPKILFVDDSKTARKTAVKILSDKYIVHEAVNGKDAWQQLQENDDISAIFADIQMPEINGLQLLQKIRTSPDRRIAQIPVIMITGHSDSHAAMRAVFEMGATGFVSKPFSDIDLISTSRSYINLNRRLEELEATLGIDRQSGLFNETRFAEEGSRMLSLALRHNYELSIINFELTSLSDISTNHSNKIATQVVIEVARRIKKHMREEEIIARTGPAKFALLLPMTSSFKAKIAVKRIQNAIKNMVFVVNKQKIQVELSAGISGIGLTNRKINFAQLCKRADHALHKTLNGSNENITNYYDGSGNEDKISKVDPYDDILSESLMHIIDGDYRKINDENILHVTSKLKPFMQYALVKTGS